MGKEGGRGERTDTTFNLIVSCISTATTSCDVISRGSVRYITAHESILFQMDVW